MARKFHRHRLLLDEGFPVRSYFPLLNRRFDVKHIAQDFKKVSLSDRQVHQFAAEQDGLVVTLNIKDFRLLSPTNKNSGVIGISAGLPFDQVDKKLTSLLKIDQEAAHGQAYYYQLTATRKYLLGKC